MKLHRLGRFVSSAGLVLLAFALVASGLTVAGPRKKPRKRARPSVEQALGTLSQANSRNGSAILSADSMGPGDVATGEVTVANTGRVPGSFDLASSHLEEGLGVGGAKLSDRLVLQVDDVTVPKRPATLYQGPLAALGQTGVGNLSPKGRRTYRFRVSFPQGQAGPAEDNAYQRAWVRVEYDWLGTAIAPLRLKLGIHPVHKLGTGRSLAVAARCDRPCWVEATATVRTRWSRKPITVGRLRRAWAPGTGAKLKLPLSTRTLRAIATRSRKTTIKVKITAVARDSAGWSTTATRTIKVVVKVRLPARRAPIGHGISRWTIGKPGPLGKPGKILYTR